MEAAKTKEVRNLLIIISMLRGFEEAEAVQILRSAAENPEAAGIAHPCYCVQATPKIREAWRSAAVASDFCHRWIDQLQMEEAETEVPFFVDRRSNDQVASWSGNIETEDRSLRSDQAHARAPWSTSAARQSFTWQSGSTVGRGSVEKREEARQGNAPNLTECTLTKASAGMDAKPRFDLKAPTSKKCT